MGFENYRLPLRRVARPGIPISATVPAHRGTLRSGLALSQRPKTEPPFGMSLNKLAKLIIVR